ncbi:MAG: hypothetical protein ACI4C1_01705 [Lachnospiraceae bacterium]
MKKRIFAWIGIILLIALYISTLIFALMDSALAQDLLRASIFSTILIPVLLYAVTLAIRVRKNNIQDDENIDDTNQTS